MSYYRAIVSPEGLEASRARAERKLDMPILAFVCETGVGADLIDTMRLVATDVRGGVFGECGHYMPEEAPRRSGRAGAQVHEGVNGIPSPAFARPSVTPPWLARSPI